MLRGHMQCRQAGSSTIIVVHAHLVAFPQVLLVEGHAVGGLPRALNVVEGVDVRLLDVADAVGVEAAHDAKQVPCMQDCDGRSQVDHGTAACTRNRMLRAVGFCITCTPTPQSGVPIG